MHGHFVCHVSNRMLNDGWRELHLLFVFIQHSCASSNVVEKARGAVESPMHSPNDAAKVVPIGCKAAMVHQVLEGAFALP